MDEEQSPNLLIEIAWSLERANSLLNSTSGGFISTSSTDIKISENFFPLLIREVAANRSVDTFDPSPRLFNFFRGREQTKFPCDLDTTSIALTVLPQNDRRKLNAILDEMLTYRNGQGIFQVYFDRSRPRTDATVCCNILSFFASCKRLADPDVAPTLNYVFEVLETRAYLPEGTRYYPSPEVFLYFVERFVERSDAFMPMAGIKEKWSPVLRQRVAERVGVHCSPLALAMRILLCDKLSISTPIDAPSSDVKSLLKSQSANGGWSGGWLCGYPSTGINIENIGYTTCLAVAALELHV